MGDREREPGYAWVVVGVLFLAQAVALGVRGTIGLLVTPWENEFGWGRAAVSVTASLGFVVYGVAQVISGRWADRIGPRVIFAASIALLGVGTAAVSTILTLWQAYVIFGILIMFAIGGASSPTSAVAVARWFTARRGLALGVVSAGSAAGQFVLVPVMAALIGMVGWRSAFLWLSAAILVVALPTILFLLRDDPDAQTTKSAGEGLRGEPPMTLAEITRHSSFWYLALSFFVCGVTTSGLIDTHFIPYALDHHVAAVTAATAFGVLSLVNMIFTTLSGAVSDRLGYTRLLGWIYAGRAVTLVYLLFAGDPTSLFIFAVAFGIVDFSTVAPTTALSTVMFGRRSAGAVFGLVAFSHQIGSALGSYTGGLLHDLTGSYASFILAGAALSGAAAFMSWAISEGPVREVAPT
jgi:MFS family permease